MKKIKLLVAFGTRPEAIKMCPLIKELLKRENICAKIVFTGQHRAIADEVMSLFGITPDYDMNIMKDSQTLFDITGNILSKAREILQTERPSGVLVHGDTTTAFAVSLAAFYMGIPVYHVEAGLRSHNMKAPFPEEFNRRAISLMSDMHFAPTHTAAENLIHEGISHTNVSITGNTVIDALKYTLCEEYDSPYISNGEERIIFLTAHRRESIGKALENMLLAVKDIVYSYSDVRVIYPVHPNPKIKRIAKDVLGDCERVTLCPPLGVVDCHNIMARSYILLTDSGGIQEEAAALGKPVLIMRELTERPEGILSGVAKLSGTDRYQIVATAKELLDNPQLYAKMCTSKNPYGDGSASVQITDAICKKLHLSAQLLTHE